MKDIKKRKHVSKYKEHYTYTHTHMLEHAHMNSAYRHIHFNENISPRLEENIDKINILLIF